MKNFKTIKSLLLKWRGRLSRDERKFGFLRNEILSGNLKKYIEAEQGRVKPNQYDKNLLKFAELLAEAENAVFIHPHNFAGYLDHYHHYFGSVTVPIMELAAIGFLSRDRVYMIADYGPVQDEVFEIAEYLGIKLKIYPRVFAQLTNELVQFGQLHLPSYDYSYHSDWWLKPHQIKNIREIGFGFSGIIEDQNHQTNRPQILYIDRAPPDQYYHSSASSTGSSGAQRRSIPNSDRIIEKLESIGQIKRVFLERFSLAEKIKLFHESDLIIGQMGAGMNGILWSKRNSAVLEIQPLDTIKRDFAAYGNMASSLGILHYRILQERPHSPVDPDLVLAWARRAIYDQGVRR